MKRIVFIALALSCIVFFSIRPLLGPGYFPMHDDAQVARVFVMAQALVHGQFPVRMVSGLGYGFGYPLFNFYGPLPYYTGAVFHLIGIDVLTATKLMMIMGVAVGTVAVYLLAGSVLGMWAGLYAAALFTYIPYRAVQLYVRGAVGELWAVSFLGVLVLGVLGLVGGRNRMRYTGITALGLAAMILSHTVLGYIATAAVLFLSILFIIIGSMGKTRRNGTGIALLLASLTGLGLTAFFWLPAASEMGFTNVSREIGKTASYWDHFVCPGQLWNSVWGFGGSVKGCVDGMSFKLGKLHIGLFLAAVVWFFLKRRERGSVRPIMVAFFGLSCLFVYLTLSISEPIWQLIPFSAFIQYPWRFLGPAAVFGSVASGYLMYRQPNQVQAALLVLLGTAAIWVNAKWFTPQYLYEKPVSAFTQAEELQFRASKASDEYLPKDFAVPSLSSGIAGKRVVSAPGLTVLSQVETEVYGRYELEASEAGKLRLDMAYFPGWEFRINGKSVVPDVVGGQPYVVLSAGHMLLETRFRDTPVRTAGNLISLLSLVGIGVIGIYGKKIIRNHRHSRI